MDKGYRFFVEAVSEAGAEALQKAGKSIPGLEEQLIPRSIVGWTVAQAEGYTGPLPGIEDSHLSLVKTEDSYSGILSVDGTVAAFAGAPLVEVAAGIGVMLGVEIEEGSLKKKELARLGESVDKLIAHIAQRKKAERTEKAELPGQPAAPRGQEGPVAPDAPRKQRRRSAPNPRLREMFKREVSLSAEDLRKTCPSCEFLQFKKTEFIGCKCITSAEGAKLTKSGTRYIFTPGPAWTPADLSVFLLTVRQ